MGGRRRMLVEQPAYAVTGPIPVVDGSILAAEAARVFRTAAVRLAQERPQTAMAGEAARDAGRALVSLAEGHDEVTLRQFLRPDPGMGEVTWTVACFQVGGLVPCAEVDFASPAMAVASLAGCREASHVTAELVATTVTGFRWTALVRTDRILRFQLPSKRSVSEPSPAKPGALPLVVAYWRDQLGRWAGEDGAAVALAPDPVASAGLVAAIRTVAAMRTSSAVPVDPEGPVERVRRVKPTSPAVEPIGPGESSPLVARGGRSEPSGPAVPPRLVETDRRVEPSVPVVPGHPAGSGRPGQSVRRRESDRGFEGPGPAVAGRPVETDRRFEGPGPAEPGRPVDMDDRVEPSVPVVHGRPAESGRLTDSDRPGAGLIAPGRRVEPIGTGNVGRSVEKDHGSERPGPVGACRPNDAGTGSRPIEPGRGAQTGSGIDVSRPVEPWPVVEATPLRPASPPVEVGRSEGSRRVASIPLLEPNRSVEVDRLLEAPRPVEAGHAVAGYRPVETSLPGQSGRVVEGSGSVPSIGPVETARPVEPDRAIEALRPGQSGLLATRGRVPLIRPVEVEEQLVAADRANGVKGGDIQGEGGPANRGRADALVSTPPILSQDVVVEQTLGMVIEALRKLESRSQHPVDVSNDEILRRLDALERRMSEFQATIEMAFERRTQALASYAGELTRVFAAQQADAASRVETRLDDLIARFTRALGSADLPSAGDAT